MSEKVVEDIVENTAVFLAKNSSSANLRDWLWSLYQYEAQYDTSFTAFRQMPLLLRSKLWHRFKPKDTPQFQTHVELFQSKVDQFIENGEGYFKSPYLYAEVGSEVWKSWVEAGMLKGEDTQTPVGLHIVEIATAVASLESTKANQELTHWWFALLANDFFNIEIVGPKSRITEFKKLPATQNFLQFAQNAKSAEHFREFQGEWPYSHLDFQLDDVSDSLFLRWWFGQKSTSSKQLNVERAFKALDRGALPRSKSEIVKRQEKGEQTLTNIFDAKPSKEDWTAIVLNTVAFPSWGPYGILYGIRFLNVTMDDYFKQVNQNLVTEFFFVGLRHASRIRSTTGSVPKEMLAFKPGKKGVVAAITDEHGFAAVDYMFNVLHKVPRATFNTCLNNMFLKKMIPDYTFHPYFELEVIRQLKPTKTKKAMMDKIRSALISADPEQKWLELNHLNTVLKGE